MVFKLVEGAPKNWRRLSAATTSPKGAAAMTAGNVAYLLVATAILATLVFFVGRTIRDIVRIAKSKPSEPGDWFWAIFIALLILIGLVLGVGPGPFDIPMSSIVKHVPYSD